jgi:NAD-dependent DNA ligase
MNQIELDFMKGMVSILNDAAESYYNGKAIITNEQYDVRFEDLKQLEEETGVVFANSPTIKSNKNVSDKINYFVCNQEYNDVDFVWVKELGINIISEEELLKMIN